MHSSLRFIFGFLAEIQNASKVLRARNFGAKILQTLNIEGRYANLEDVGALTPSPYISFQTLPHKIRPPLLCLRMGGQKARRVGTAQPERVPH
ncbi:hypothetical protein Y032_0439g1493 [Ancylostoma ceylanicum]|uniref:Uncharacterized protein n=1 Tax=Ancylostoma ceylanicum TaxID=53326 RepID=A0A016WZL6_9BILA|nr:hypothetical protein Y032_0439g1493 [Ancylostoma ceylanicum]